MATFEFQSGSGTYEIDAPDEASALKAWRGAGVSGAAGTEAAPGVEAAPAPWSVGRVARDLGHYPAMLGEATLNGIGQTVNLPIIAANIAKHYAEPYLMPGAPPTDPIPTFPPVSFGEIAQPANAPEAYAKAATGGAASALLGGVATKLGTVMGAAGKEIAGALPGLLREAGVLGAVPGVAVEGAQRSGALAGITDPFAREIAEGAVGVIAAIVSHHFLSGNPVEAVAAKLGSSENSDDAGVVAKRNVQQWREQLGAKLDDLKGTMVGPTAESLATDGGTVQTANLFGKVPLKSATIDNSETMNVAHALSNEGGVYKDFYHNFVSKMPEGVRQLFDSVAQGNNPIEAFSPQRRAAGPIPTYRDGEVPGESNTYGPAVDLHATPETQGPGLRGGYEVPRAGATQPSPTAPRANGAQGPSPFLHTGPEPDNGYRPNWQFGLNNPPDAAAEGPLSAASAPSAPHRNEIIKAPPPPLPPQAERGGPWGPTNIPEPPEPPRTSNPVVPRDAGPTNAPGGFVPPTRTTLGFQAPLEDALKLRSTIGEWLSNPSLMPKGIEETHAKAYYAALSADIGNTMERYGARPEWDDYNTKATSLYRAGNLISKFADSTNEAKDSANAGKAVKSVWTGMKDDSSEVANLRAQVPEAADEIAAAFIRSSPEKWSALPPASKAALVPNPFDRLALDTHAVRKTTLAEQLQHTGEPLIGGEVGYHMADALMPRGMAEGSTGLMSPAAWGVAAALAPSGIRFLGRIKNNPRMLGVPLLGGIAGSAGANAAENPLVSEQKP